MPRPNRSTRAALALVLALGGCGSSDGDQCTPADPIDPPAAAAPDPADFVDGNGDPFPIDNSYWPLPVGTTWTFAGQEDGETIDDTVMVTDEAKTVMGIAVVVVRDTVSLDGELAEATDDWYAQDADGNVWYLGEDTAEYEEGEITSTEGSWEAGVDGALPGVIMPAAPAVGDDGTMEYYPGHAEDMWEVLAVGETITVEAGTYSDVLRTREWTPLEPCVSEEKWYAPGVGFIKSTITAGGNEDAELVSVTDAD
jgi:hypothetical protein